MPRYILLLKATLTSESGAPPNADLITAIAAYDDSLKESGALLGGEALHPSKRDCARIAFSARGAESVARGPFPNLQELVTGYWIIKTEGFEEAVEWAKKCPIREVGATIEVRRVMEDEDFGEMMGESGGKE